MAVIFTCTELSKVLDNPGERSWSLGLQYLPLYFIYVHVTYTLGHTFLNREIDKFTVKKFKVQTPHHDNNAYLILCKLILYRFSLLILFQPSGLLSVPPIGLSYLWASANAVPSSWDTLPHTSCLAHSSYPSVLDFITVLSERCS